MQITNSTPTSTAFQLLGDLARNISSRDPQFEPLLSKIHHAFDLVQANRQQLASEALREIGISIQKNGKNSLTYQELSQLFFLLFVHLRPELAPSSEVFADACSFVIGISDRVNPDDVLQTVDRPLPSDVSSTLDTINRMLHDFPLEKKEVLALWMPVDGFGKDAVQPLNNQNEDLDRRVNMIADFGQTVSMLEGGSLTKTQINEFLATIFLSKAALCPVGELPVLSQLLIFLAPVFAAQFFGQRVCVDNRANAGLVRDFERVLKNPKSSGVNIETIVANIKKLTPLQINKVKTIMMAVLAGPPAPNAVVSATITYALKIKPPF